MVTDISKVKTFPKKIRTHQELIEEALSRGARDAKIILTKTISLGNWVHLRCQFGCPFYGKRFTCPDFSPTSPEMADILSDYKKALIVQTVQASDIQELVLNLEINLRNKGYHKAFALGSLPCNLCETCTIQTQCQHPELARPTLQACGIDVIQTLSNIGWAHHGFSHPCTDHCAVGLVLFE